MLFRKKFLFKIMLFGKNFFFKIGLFKYARKTQNLRILRGKMSQNVIFCVQKFFRNLPFKNDFFFKIVLFTNFFFFKIVVFKYARKTQKLCLLRGKMSQNVIFCVQKFFQNLPFKNNFFRSKSCF